jgi:iron complex outermembrane receptor protein
MPSDRYSLDIKGFTKTSSKMNEIYIQAGYQFITKQWRVPQNIDFAPPPKAYGLLSAEIGGSFAFGKQQLNISVTANNVLDEIYRDYLDRFRYFANSQGQNYTLRIKVPLTIYDKK